MRRYLFIVIFGIKQYMQINNILEELYPPCGCRALRTRMILEIYSHVLIKTFQLSFDIVELNLTAKFK